METGSERYTLSDDTLQKLRQCEILFRSDPIIAENSVWKKLFKIEEDDRNKNEMEDETPMEVDESSPKSSQKSAESKEYPEAPSTQFFFTQSIVKPPSQKAEVIPVDHEKRSKLTDTIGLIFESLESKNACMDPKYIKILSDADVIEVIESLSKELSLNGVHNLCHCICDMEDDQTAYWIKIICSKMLLQKIIDLDVKSVEPRIMSNIIRKVSKTFPHDVQCLIFIPMLNSDLKSTTVIESIVKSLGHLKTSLLSDFITNVKELKPWHVTLLSLLADKKIEDTKKDPLLALLMGKASAFSKEKYYSQFMVKFLKLNHPYTEEEKNMLEDIVSCNDTAFKPAMTTLIKNMYIHRNLWHIAK